MTTRIGIPTPSKRGDNVAVADVTGWYRTCMATHKLHILQLTNNLAAELAIFIETWGFRPERSDSEEWMREVDAFYFDVISNSNRFFDIIADDTDPEPGQEDEDEPVLPTERLEKAIFKLSNPISGSKPQKTSRQQRGSEFATQSSQPLAPMTRPSMVPANAVAGPSGTKHGPECSCPACRRVGIVNLEADTEDPIYGNGVAQAQQTQVAATKSKVTAQSENPRDDPLIKTSETLNFPTLRPRSRRLEKLQEEERQRGSDSGLRNSRTKERGAAELRRESTPEKSNEKGKNKSKDVAIRITQSTTEKASTKTAPKDGLNEQHRPKAPTSRKTKRLLEEDDEKELVPVPGKRQSKRRKMT